MLSWRFILSQTAALRRIIAQSDLSYSSIVVGKDPQAQRKLS